MPFVQQPLFVDRSQNVPDTFDVVVSERHVRMIHIRPVADCLRQLPPLLLVLEHARLAALHELRHTVVLDLMLPGDAQLLFHAKLHWQAMRIPACFAHDAVSGHRFVTPDEVFDHPPEHVSDMRLTICRRRPFVKHVVRFAEPIVHRFLKGAILFPLRQHTQLACPRLFFDVDFSHFTHPSCD